MTLVAAVLLGGHLLIRLTVPRQQINFPTAARVRAGMTEREVEQLIGGPTGDYRTRPVLTGRSEWKKFRGEVLGGELRQEW